jgi:hypothetical protein
MTEALIVPGKEPEYLGMDNQRLENQKSNSLFSNEVSHAWFTSLSYLKRATDMPGYRR